MKSYNFEDQNKIMVALNRAIGVRMISHSSTGWLLFSIFYKLTVVAILTCVIYIHSTWMIMLSMNSVIGLTYVILEIVAYICVITMQILSLWYYKDLALLRKNIAETDESLKKLNVVVDHRNVLLWPIFLCTLSFVNASIFTFIAFFHNLKIMCIDAPYSFMLYMGGLVIFDFMAHVCWLGNNFKRTSDLLKMFFIEECHVGMKEWNDKMVSSWLQRCFNEWKIEGIAHRHKIVPCNDTQLTKYQFDPENKISRLQQIRFVHLQLCVITKSLNKIFDKQLMFFSTLVAVNLVAILYYFYIEFSKHLSPYENEMVLNFYYVLDASYSWIKVVLVCVVCEKTIKEAKNVARILHVCSIHNTDVDIKHELVQFSLQVSLSELHHEDSRVFWLNDGFVTQSVGAVVTYLLVMIQWNESISNVDSSNVNATVITQN